MLAIFLFLPLLMVFMFMNLSVRAIILSTFTLLPVSAIWMGYNILKQHGSPCLDSSSCIVPLFAEFSPLTGWIFIAVAILTACLGGFLIHENKKNWSWADVAMLLVYGGVVVGLVIAGSWTLELLQL